MEDRGAYRGDRLHAQDEWIRSQVPRVREGVLLPQLSEQILFARHVRMVEGEVSCCLSQRWRAYNVLPFSPSKKRWMVPAKATLYQQPLEARTGLVSCNTYSGRTTVWLLFPAKAE